MQEREQSDYCINALLTVEPQQKMTDEIKNPPPPQQGFLQVDDI